MVDLPTLPIFPKRPPNCHKGDMGRILIVAGSREYQGAGVLAATAALRGGAGLVHFAFPSVLYDCYASRLTEVILHPMPSTESGSMSFAALNEILALAAGMNAAAVGPGLSQNAETKVLATKLYASLAVPTVFDADALNAISDADVDLSVHLGHRVLTPHPGEFKRLAAGRILDLPSDTERVIALANLTLTTVVYKSARPIIGGAGRVAHVTSGSAALATAGTGDVLTGLIAALLHRFPSAFDAAWVGSYIHGRLGSLAGDKMTEECVIASDLFSFFPSVFRELIGREDV